MALTKDEKVKLELFKDMKLNKIQIEAIIGRLLTDSEYEQMFPKDYKSIFSPIARQAANVAKNKRILKPDYAKIFRKVADDEIKQRHGIPSKKYSDRPSIYLRQMFKTIASEAANKASRIIKAPKDRISKIDKNTKQEEPANKYHFTKSLFKHNNINNYTIKKVNTYINKRFNTEQSQWRVSGTIDIFNTHSVISDLVRKMTENQPNNVRLQVSLSNSNNGQVMQTKLLGKQEITNNLAEWVNIFIDYHDMEIEDITFKLIAIEIPSGAGRRVNAIIDPQSKRSIIQVKNYDSICLARAIVVALARLHKEKLQDYFKNKLIAKEIEDLNLKKINKTKINEGIISENDVKALVNGRVIQEVLAKVLHRLCKVPIKQEGNDFQDVKLFEDSLGIQVTIFNFETTEKYRGVEAAIQVYLLLKDNHFDVISKLPGFLCTNESHHIKEDSKCKACKEATKCDVSLASIICIKCYKYFYGQICHDNHIKNKKCITHSYKCPSCNRFFKTELLKLELHKCDEFQCGNCKLWMPYDHKCFMLRKDLKAQSDKYIFYDFETKCTAEGKHIVNYCIAQYMNGKEEFIFDTLDGFCNWAFKKKHRNYTVLAHYGKGYDFQFVAEWLIAHNVKPNIIHNGQKILLLEVKRGYNIRFIDSISFTLMPLRDFPKTFGLVELTKGYFPHKFNTDENQKYIGIFPDKQFYGYEEMKKDNKKEFDEWYETTTGQKFNFRDEMHKYCKSDVDILRRGCIEYRNLFLEISQIDPFQYITLASVCSAIYRKEFLPLNTIATYNENATDNYSIKAIKWLKYISSKESINLRHACNGGEVAISANGKQYKVDGYCEETKTIYQFHGCYFHGCKYCYDELTVNKVSRHNMKYLYKRTENIETLLKSRGYKVVSIWEHEFDKNKNIKNISLDEYDLVPPPKIRDCFQGGRCEPVKLIYDFKTKKERGKYIDVVSLYPTVMFYDKYPTGHPKKIFKPKEYNHNWFGFIYCKVLPPRGLYMPVLPYKQVTKQAHKLVFGLCRTCMGFMDAKCSHHKNAKCKRDCPNKPCQACKDTRIKLKLNCQDCYQLRNLNCVHSDSERALIGFWTTAEVEKALEKGYKIDYIYEVWNFENKSAELWKGYIQKFLKIKLETSKFTCGENEYRDKANKVGIELGELKENSGLRFISKICLNSLWGKFGQNPKMKHSDYIDNEKDFYKIILDGKIENLSICFLNDNMVYTNYEIKDEFLKVNYNTNIFIACFTSSWARLRLYDMLDNLGKNICYCDTDSVVYIENEETKVIANKCLGDSLGEWADELNGRYMDFWCCAQAKDYGYILNDGKQSGKVKGFRVNAETEDKMTIEQRIQLIKRAIDNVNVNYDQFVIKNCEIFTKHMVKLWAFKFDKRMIRLISENEIDTLPYGY